MGNNMKNVLKLLLLALSFCACSGAQNDARKSEVSSDAIVADSLRRSCLSLAEWKYDFGNVEKLQEELVHTFEFVNKGNYPLVIYKTDVACGCVRAEFDKEPVPPLGKGKITVYFNPKNQYGKVRKGVYIKSNAKNDVEVVYILANVQ